MSTVTSTAEWIGSGVLGLSALALVAAAARLGASSAHAGADAECAAYAARRVAATPPPAPELVPFEIPPMPDRPPADTAHDQTLSLREDDVKAYRARHAKGQPVCI